MKYLLSLLLSFPFSLLAQTSISGIVTDKNKNPLPLTNIGLLNKNKGCITDENGKFILLNISVTDSIKISNITYMTQVIAIKDLKENDTVALAENIEKLDNVVVKNFSGYKLEAIMGFKDFDNNGEFKFGPGDQIATYITNREGKEGWVKGIFFKVKQFGRCINSIRVRLLQFDTLNLKPSADLLDENILITSGDLKKNNYVDLSNNKLAMPKEGIVILLEWVYEDNDCDKKSYTSIAANLATPINVVWFNFRDKDWKKSNRPRLPNGNYMTPNVALKVAY